MLTPNWFGKRLVKAAVYHAQTSSLYKHLFHLLFPLKISSCQLSKVTFGIWTWVREYGVGLRKYFNILEQCFEINGYKGLDFHG